MQRAIRVADTILRFFERLGALITTGILLLAGVGLAIGFLHDKEVGAWVPIVVGVPLLVLIVVAYALGLHSTPSPVAPTTDDTQTPEYEKELIVNALESIQQAVGGNVEWDVDDLVERGILGPSRGLLIGSRNQDVRVAVLMPTDDPPMTFGMRWAAGHRPESVAKYSRQIDDTLAGAAFRRGEIVDRPNVEADPDFRKNPKATRGFASLYAQPLRIDEGIVGALSVVSNVKNAFSASDIAFIKIIAALLDVVLAVEHDADRFQEKNEALLALLKEEGIDVDADEEAPPRA